jgi:hypothetical protein
VDRPIVGARPDDAADGGTGPGTMGGAQPLPDGLVGRRSGPWTPTVHAWLRHLLALGVSGVPRPVDVVGDRERQQRLPGTPGWHPPHRGVRADSAVAQLVDRLRAVHAAAATFAPPTTPVWAAATGLPGPGEVVVHGDLGMWNTLWDDAGQLSGLVDWDLAEPGPAWWDVANLVWALVPLARVGEAPPRDGWQPAQRHRLGLLGDELGRAPDELLTGVGDWLDLQVRRRTDEVPPGALWAELATRDEQRAGLRAQRDWVRAGAPGLR